MKKTHLRNLIEQKDRIERGEATPAAVWEVFRREGGITRRKIDPKEFQRKQKDDWERSISGARHRLGLSQVGFASLLGISVRTLHHWEQGTRKPSGAARVLLRIAEKHPALVLDAAA